MRSGGQPARRVRLQARRALAAACERRGWQLLEAREEAGFPAEERTRPGLEEARRVLERADRRRSWPASGTGPRACCSSSPP